MRQAGAVNLVVLAAAAAAAMVAMHSSAGGRPSVLASRRGLEGGCGTSGCRGGPGARTNPAASSLSDLGIAVHEAAEDVADAREGVQYAIDGVDGEGLARQQAQAANWALVSRRTMLTDAKTPAGRSSLHAQSKLPFGSDTFPVGFVDRWPPLMAPPPEVAAVEDRARDITPQKVSDDERAVARARGEQREGREMAGGSSGSGRDADTGDAVFDTQVAAARHIETLSDAMVGLHKALVAVRRQQMSRASRHATQGGSGGLRALPAWSDLVGQTPSWDAGRKPRLKENKGAKADGGESNQKASKTADKKAEAKAEEGEKAVAEAKATTEAAEEAVRAAMAVFKSAGCNAGSDASRMSQAGRQALPGCALSVTSRDVSRAQVSPLTAPCGQPAAPRRFQGRPALALPAACLLCSCLLRAGACWYIRLKTWGKQAAAAAAKYAADRAQVTPPSACHI